MVKRLFLCFPAEEEYPLPGFVVAKYMYHYHLTPMGTKVVKTVIDVIGFLSPEIISCPLLYPMTSLFLCYMDAEKCCDCMQALLRSESPVYFTQTKTGAEVTKFVLRDLAKKYTVSGVEEFYSGFHIINSSFCSYPIYDFILWFKHLFVDYKV